MKILVLDNYDSFTYNLVHILRELGLGTGLEVHRNDRISLQAAGAFDKIILSPGPGLPRDAGIMPELIQTYAATKPMLGVCLGHQALAENFGGKLKLLSKVKHGIASKLHIAEAKGIFRNIPQHCSIGHYHSWAVDEDSLPAELQVTAYDSEGSIMALQHKQLPCAGVQFHPESVMTPFGKQMIKNWLENSESHTFATQTTAV